MTMKPKMISFFLYAAMLSICLSAPSVATAKRIKAIGDQYQNKVKSFPKYRVGFKDRIEDGQLLVQISIDPQHFNREDMMALARQLNRDLSREQIVVVVISDEYQAAKSP